MPSPTRAKRHSFPHNQLGTWLGIYASETPGVECGDNSSIRLDPTNEPQPDLLLMKLPEKGGQAWISTDDYIEGAPELAVEIVGSTRAYDLHQKKGAYCRNGVQEYLAWITGEQLLVWWELRDGEYHDIAPTADGLLKSRVFPGLWLDSAALLSGNMKAVLTSLRAGLDSPEHRAFLKKNG
jgi:Uma2 family endonuclease